MKTENSFRQDWDDLVFEKRNKSYGAYTLRKSYSRTISEAALVSFLFAGLAIGLPRVYSMIFGNSVAIPKLVIPGGLKLTQEPRIQVREDLTKIKKIFTRVRRDVMPVVTTAEVIEKPQTAEPIDGSAAGLAEGTGEGTTSEGTSAGEVSVAAAPVPHYGTLDFAEVMPSYTGGQEAMMKFIQKKLRYPHYAQSNGIEGKVYVQFVVNTEGKVADVKVIRGISIDCDQEAARVISSMPGWQPGMMGRTAVSVRMMLPIYFKLN